MHTSLTIEYMYYGSSLYRRKIFDQIQDFVHFNISLGLLLGLYMFVFGVELAKDDDVRIE